MPEAFELLRHEDPDERVSTHDGLIVATVREVLEGTDATLWFSHDTAAMLHGAWQPTRVRHGRSVRSR
ncbi:hypothetical protein M1843_11595 [Isoptericola sp. 4D.3]|uniref:Uncharacterized protein n=1 Tax=Isoptericola peretonis TaxID=2918523 RepID=A0ABT0J4G8_9MICO|nr:hypothetical protein [Isoptericola sp. 4D.3]